MGVTSTGSHLMGAYNQLSTAFLHGEINCCDGLVYLGGLENILHGLSDLRTDTITLNHGDGVLALYIQTSSISIVAMVI